MSTDIVYVMPLCYYFPRGVSMDNIRVEIGRRAYAARTKLNLKQSDVAAVIGIHQTTYSRFENGEGDITAINVIKLCEILKIYPSWLLGETSIPQLTDSECLEIENYKKYIIDRRNK